MNPIDAALAKVQKNPDHPSSKVLCSLLVALDTGEPFSFKQLYKVLDYNDFTLALGVMREWRLEEMRCKKGQLSSAAGRPESCYLTWSKFREEAFGGI